MNNLSDLHKYLKYNPSTGIIHWIALTKTGESVNKPAGSLHTTGYINIWFKANSYRAHRLAYFLTYGYIPKQIDHINGIRDDNRLINLRPATSLMNTKNTKKYKSNTTGVMGIHISKNKRWEVRISNNNKRISLGTYTDFFEACCARKSAELKYGFHTNHGR